MRRVRALIIGCIVLACAGEIPLATTAEGEGPDAGLRPYRKVSGISGAVTSIGSDTLNNLMTLWAEGFRRQYPNVKIQVEGKGSSTAPPALIEGTAQLGPMSRLMKTSEVDKFEAKFGYPPAAYPVAVDALAEADVTGDRVAGVGEGDAVAVDGDALAGGGLTGDGDVVFHRHAAGGEIDDATDGEDDRAVGLADGVAE